MGTGGAFYLAMTIVAGGGFAGALAFYSWRHARWQREREAREQAAKATRTHAPA